MTTMHGGAKSRDYAVLWREGDSGVNVGRVALADGTLTLSGRERGGRSRHCAVPLSLIRSVRIGHVSAERLHGMPSLIVERHRAAPILIAQAAGIGAVHELADLLASALSAA